VVTIIPYDDIGAGHDVVNVIHYQGQPISFDNAQLQAVRDEFDSIWGNGFRPLVPTTTHYKGCVVIDSGSAFGGDITNDTFVPVPGTAVAGPVADNAAVLLSLHVLQRYKGGHGRVYLPGFSLDMLATDGRTVLGSTVTTVEGVWNNTAQALGALTTGQGGPYKPVLWHKKWAAAPNSTSDIVSVTCQTILASQRRRLRKVSRHKKKVP